MHTYITVVLLSLLSIVPAVKAGLTEISTVREPLQISSAEPSAGSDTCSDYCSSDRGSGRVNRYKGHKEFDATKERGSGRLEEKTPKEMA
ncbi:hypothetical protein [Spirulina subsalsa]|uniref:hypothetical protein n=1 Tax=Spirulina subsalsa TaxID=54311 RepID=UPI000381CEBF|nr:hypothetical protein [Spirulina subsalsa]